MSLKENICRHHLVHVSWTSRIDTLNKLVQEYVKKFDEFLIRYNALNTEGQSQIL